MLSVEGHDHGHGHGMTDSSPTLAAETATQLSVPSPPLPQGPLHQSFEVWSVVQARAYISQPICTRRGDRLQQFGGDVAYTWCLAILEPEDVCLNRVGGSLLIRLVACSLPLVPDKQDVDDLVGPSSNPATSAVYGDG